MQNRLQQQSGAASSYVSLEPVSTALGEQHFLPTFSPPNEYPTVLLNLDGDDYCSRQQVPDVNRMANYPFAGDGEAVESEYLQGGGTAPININGRKRTYTSSSAHTSDPMDTLDPSPHMNSLMEQNHHLEDDDLTSVTSPKQGRGSMIASSSFPVFWQTSENSSDAFSMDEQSSSPVFSTLTGQCTPPKTGDHKRAEKNSKESINSADREIINSCLQPGIQLLNDNGLTKMGDLSIDWVKAPAKKVRPSYNCEGSRGAIKTEDGNGVELNVNLASGVSESYVAVIIAACIADKKGQKVDGHPHFQTNCVADQPSMETTVDGVPAICIKRSISGEHNKLKMDVGLKRSSGRTSKLDRKCRVIYRLCLLRRQVNTEGSVDWITAHWAQIVTDTISCEQSQGPPSITCLTSTTSPASGGMVVAVKGKNLESKADGKPNVVVKFIHKPTNWSAKAQVYNNVTTKESLAFMVPPFKRWKEMVRHDPSITSVSVSVEVSVDNKASENSTDFKFTEPLTREVRARGGHSSTANSDSYHGLGYDDVVSVLHEVEKSDTAPRSRSRSMNNSSAGIVGALEGFEQQTFSFPPNHPMPETQRRVWKAEPSLSSSCMMNQRETQDWDLHGYEEQAVNQHVEHLHIDDKAVVHGMWSPSS